MWQTIQTLIEEKKAMFGVSVTDVERKENFSIHGDEPFQQASVFKIPILLSLLKQIDQGKLTLHDRVTITAEDTVSGSGVIKDLQPGLSLTYYDLATLMIIVSDNLATDKLLSLIGLETVQNDLKTWGFPRTTMQLNTSDLLAHSVGLSPEPYSPTYAAKLRKRLQSQAFDSSNKVFRTETETNTTTPNEMNRILYSLYNRELLSEESTTVALDILGRQQLNRRIPKYLPTDVSILHKTGSLNDHLNDAGIIFLPKERGTLILSIFSRGHVSTIEGEEDIANIAKQIVQPFYPS